MRIFGPDENPTFFDYFVLWIKWNGHSHLSVEKKLNKRIKKEEIKRRKKKKEKEEERK